MEMNPLLKTFVNSSLWASLLERWFLPPLFKAMPAAPKRILEIGCGRGDTTALLLARYPSAKITATDFDAAQVALAARRVVSRRVTFRQADAAALPFKDAAFDLVVEFNTFHHVERWVAAFAECSRVLAPRGVMAAMDEPLALWNPVFRWFDRPDALFTRDEFMFAAGNAGLMLEKDLGSKRIIKALFRKKETP
ncbi:MAG TPA: class I SAM-dependent methyltransferase [Candidatus Eisenbacteria bacterium]|jgi:ubiquinone/menaquinone biosynthesis C-methylase UbiE|nr:class I SAM-dependent methyltransferase [Candidatus Eisenbacteria bacterium]